MTERFCNGLWTPKLLYKFTGDEDLCGRFAFSNSLPSLRQSRPQIKKKKSPSLKRKRSCTFLLSVKHFVLRQPRLCFEQTNVSKVIKKNLKRAAIAVGITVPLRMRAHAYGVQSHSRTTHRKNIVCIRFDGRRTGCGFGCRRSARRKTVIPPRTAQARCVCQSQSRVHGSCAQYPPSKTALYLCRRIRQSSELSTYFHPLSPILVGRR